MYNTSYDYAIFVRQVNNYIKQQKNSDLKVVKALEDTLTTLDSMNKLNPQETNLYLNIMFTALSLSVISRN